MKILIISNMYPSKQKPYSGIFVKNQYEYLKNKLNQDVEIYTIKRTFTSKIGSALKYFKAFIFFFPFLLKRYDVIHLHYFFPMIILTICYKLIHPSTKIVVTFHGSDITNFIKSDFSKKFFTILLKKCNFVISVGNDLSKLIVEKLGRKPDLVLSAGIDKNVFYHMNNIEKKYDIIFVGSFIKRKGLDILLDAIEIIKNNNITYCIVGSGELEIDVQKCAHNNNITLLKNQTQEELRVLYNQSKFFLLPSRDEPFGLVVSEAMYCGTPVIVSNIGGMKDQVKNAKNGFILQNNTSEDLAKMINYTISISNKEYEELSLNAELSNKEYSMKNVCQQLNIIYKDLINES